MKGELKGLYHKILLERSKSDWGFEKNPDAQQILEAYNPVCGDQFKLYVELDDYKMKNISYYGYGCAISKASTSLLVESLQDQSLEDCRQKIKFFFDCMEEKVEDAPEIYRALSVSKNFPGRRQCAELSWKAIKKYLDNL